MNAGAFQKKAFAFLDTMADAGMDSNEIGAMLLGMALSALSDGGRTRDEVHKMIDEVLDKRGAS